MEGMYINGVREIMAGNVDHINDDIAAVLINIDMYTPNFENDKYQADIPEEAVVAETLLTVKTLDGSTFRAANTVFINVEGPVVGAVVVIKDTGVAETSTLLMYTDSAADLPVTPDGEDITIQWDAGEAGIYKL